MNIDPAAILAVISEQAQRIAALEGECATLKAHLSSATKHGLDDPDHDLKG